MTATIEYIQNTRCTFGDGGGECCFAVVDVANCANVAVRLVSCKHLLF